MSSRLASVAVPSLPFESLSADDTIEDMVWFAIWKLAIDDDRDGAVEAVMAATVRKGVSIEVNKIGFD